ncbi:hypothetical protein [Cellulosimicrobium marinum]|uniref:hypothetical protein n=1 Tax=Cellulosimicrobium marinum TaxID=1638992 RepID=UPI001E50C774|nr:hypothetical protein [Cellulosimicrobium marinum]MCB7136219.1 hypothetical protein [Cellulosimicrobium marinum]
MSAPDPTPPPGLGDRVRRWWLRVDGVRTGTRWSSVATVLGGLVVALVCLTLVLRGRVWAWVPLVVAAAIALREIRWLQRVARNGRGDDHRPRYHENAPR